MACHKWFDQATHGFCSSRKMFYNRPDLFLVATVQESLVKTDHKAVILASAGSNDTVPISNKIRCSFHAYDRKSQYIANLCNALKQYICGQA